MEATTTTLVPQSKSIGTTTHTGTVSHQQQRKMEANVQKRQRIEQSGGIRPRPAGVTYSFKKQANTDGTSRNQLSIPSNAILVTSTNTSIASRDIRGDRTAGASSSLHQQQQQQKHRFGRVMEHVPCRNIPRYSTISIAIPSSILYNCQTRELKTILCGQIARAATIYHVDEIIIYNDGTTAPTKSSNNHYRQSRDFDRNNNNKRRHDEPNTSTNHESDDVTVEAVTLKDDADNKNKIDRPPRTSTEPHIFMARILQYCECPQYLRKHFFPIHSDLQYTGLLAPIDAPHHVRADDRCTFREGVVLQQQPNKAIGSLVNCGVRNRPVLIEQRLQPGIRCTVQLDPAAYGRPGQIHGVVVSPTTVTHSDGTYWGYTVRIASSIKAILDECPYSTSFEESGGSTGGYDLTIGTSERGNESIDDPNFTLQHRRINKSSGSYRHALIVFGGVAGIEESIDADESISISGSRCHTMFDKWINICPYQGSRTIRSEEAVLITLAKLSPFLTKAAQSTSSTMGGHASTGNDLSLNNDDGTNNIQFDKDEQLSEESSDEDE